MELEAVASDTSKVRVKLHFCWLVLVNSQLTPALVMHMTYSNRLVWPRRWHTQTQCANSLLLLHIYSVDYLYAPVVVNCEVGSSVAAIQGGLSTSYAITRQVLAVS